MDREKIIKKNKKNKKIKTILLSISVTIVLFFSINSGESYKYGKNNESKYLIEDIEIEYRYDEENYEVSSVVNNPYAIVKGESSKINLLKLKKGYKFYIDLEGATEGEYNLNVLYEGIPKDLNVEIYPLVVNVSLIEKKVLSYEPKIEIVGDEKLKEKDLILGIPEIQGLGTVKVRETQANLGAIGVIKGVIDVSKLNETSTINVKLVVYDREGVKMEDIHLLEKEIKVKIPIDKKIIVEEKVINNVIVEEKVVENIIVNSDEEKVSDLNNTLEKLKLEMLTKENEIGVKKEELLKNDKTILGLEEEIKNLKAKLEEIEAAKDEETDT